jgi:hypothetical protein
MSQFLYNHLTVHNELEASPVTILDAVSEATPEVEPEVTPEVEPEVELEVTPEVESEMTPEVESEMTPEVELEVTPEVESEMTPEMKPEIEPALEILVNKVLDVVIGLEPNVGPASVLDTVIDVVRKTGEPKQSNEPEQELNTEQSSEPASIYIPSGAGGIDWTKEFGDKKLYKVLNANMNHREFQFDFGENILTEEWNPSGSCEGGGLYFTIENEIYKFFGSGDLIATIELYPDSKIYKNVFSNGVKYKTDKFKILTVEPLDMFVGALSEELQTKAVLFDGFAIKHVKSEEIRISIIKQRPDVFEHIHDPTLNEKMAYEASIPPPLESDDESDDESGDKEPDITVHVDNIVLPAKTEPDKESDDEKFRESLRRIAVSQDCATIRYMKNPSEDIQRLAVLQHGCSIQWIKNPSRDIQRLAVMNHGDAIKYIPSCLE